MAVSVKMTNGIAALKKLGLDESFLKALEASVDVKLTAAAFEFKVNGKPAGVAPVTLDQLMALNAGSLPNAEKEKLKHKVKAVAASALALSIDVGIQQIKESDLTVMAVDLAQKHPDAPVVKAKGALGKLPILKKPQPEKVASAWPLFDLKSLKTAPMVKLRDATMMYQPVFGTSKGSRYFLVGANSEVKIAARLSGSSLSVRIEGPGWKKYKGNVELAGFSTVSSEKDYASVHLDVGNDKVMAAKTLGAVIMGLGLKLETPIPDLSVVAGA